MRAPEKTLTLVGGGKLLTASSLVGLGETPLAEKEEVVGTLETCSNLSEVSENDRLDRQIDREEIAQCVKKLKNNKTGGCDGIVGELLKYGGSGMVCLLE